MKKWLFLILAVILVTIAFLYKTPFEVSQNYYASTVNGSIVHININMKGFRNSFTPTKYRGEILVDGVKYTTIDYKTEWKITSKITGVKEYPRLISENAKSALDTKEYLTITRYSNNFDRIEFYLNDDFFYSPAKNAIEAQQIINDIF